MEVNVLNVTTIDLQRNQTEISYPETINKQESETSCLDLDLSEMCSTVLKTRSDIEHIQRKENGWTEPSFLENNAYITTEIEAYGFFTIFKKLREYIVERIEKSLILQGMCGLLIPCIAILGSLLVVAWPQHNVIDHPQYWYEVMGPVIIGNYLVTITVGLMDCHMIMKFHFIWSMKGFWKMFFVNVIGFVVPYISIHVLWVQILHYNHPMPFIGQLCWLIGFISRGAQFWFLFPTNLRNEDKDVRKRILAYLSFYPLSIVMGLGYNQMTSVFVHIPLHFQWFLGLLIPILKEFNTWWNTKIAFKASGGYDVDSKIVMIIYVLSVHSLSLTLLLPNVSSTTAFILISFESIPSLWSCIKIVKRNRQKCGAQIYGQLDETVKCLVVEEYFELLIPFVYCGSFVLAYYGPNSEVIGNVRNDYWQYEKVENLPEKLENISSFAIIVAARGFIFSCGLWITCRVNILKAYVEVIFHYGTFILLYIIATLNAVNHEVF